MPRWLRRFLHNTGIRRSPSLLWHDAWSHIDWDEVAKAINDARPRE